MKFEKGFRIYIDKTLPTWRDKFLCYKPLKKLLKNIPAAAAANTPPDGGARRISPLQVWFVAILNEEVEKFNDFYVEKEEEFIIRFQALKEKKRVLISSETEFSEESMAEIRKDFVSIHGEMVLLKSYSSLNFSGLIKILKKYDKRTGESLTLPFTQFAFHQPFFITEPLTNLVRECEENLEILFPLEAEVVDSNDIAADVANNASNSETTVDIYGSTLAAISAIQRLKTETSTYNPLSMVYLFGNGYNESTMGVITAENSPRSSFMSLDDEDDENEDF